jgi:hypothetical protein
MKGSGVNFADIVEQRVNAVKNYIKENDTGEGVILRRKEILEIVSIKEGDSAKSLMKALESCNCIEIIKEKNQSRYFYIEERAGSKNDVPNKDKHPAATLVLHDVKCIGPNRYSTTITGKELQEYWNGGTGIIKYNPLIQRGEKVVYKKDGTQEVAPIYNPNNVKKITVLILSGDYHTDTIVVNVMNDGTDELVLEGSTLYITGQTDMLDGQHRSRALDLVKKISAESENPFDLESLVFPLIIENLSLEEAQEAFYQYSQGLKISSTRSEYFNNKSYENVIVKKLLSKSDLKNKVEIVRNTIDKKDVLNIVTFATLVNSIRMAFPNIQTQAQADRIAEFLCKFYNKLIDLVPELRDYDMRTVSKETSLIAENIMFYGYTAVASILYERDDWESSMDLLLNIDYSKASKPWFGKIIRKGRKGGFSITNNMDGRSFFINAMKKQFGKLLEERMKELQVG